MKFEQVMVHLESRGDEKVRKHNEKGGYRGKQFGVKMGDLRSLAKDIKPNPELASELWASDYLEAKLLATLLMQPKRLSTNELNDLVSSISYSLVADWFGTNVVKQHPQKEALRMPWTDSSHPMTARLGWSLTAERIAKSPEGLLLTSLLDRIEREMQAAEPDVQWTMNYCLAEIGIRFEEHRERAISIGEKIGAFRDFPTSKGCTSPFAPIWIAAMMQRNG